MKKLLSIFPLNTDLAALLFRLILGGLMAYHGYTKIDNYSTFMSMSKSLIGLGAKLEFNLVIFAEFFCGLLVALGFLTRLTVIPIFIAMFVAFFVAHGKDPFQVKELAFLFMSLSFAVFVLGSGRYSVDGAIRKRR
jgi:putative oxidoreductase